METVDLIVRDWANWDDSYYFVLGLRPGFVRNNLNNATMKNIDLDLITFYDLEGRARWQTMRMGDQVGHYLNSQFPEMDSLMTTLGQNRSLFGMIETKQGFAMLSLWPIRKSDTSGRPAGILCGVTFIDDDFWRHISEQVECEVRLTSNFREIFTDWGSDGEHTIAWRQLPVLNNVPEPILAIRMENSLSSLRAEIGWMQGALLLFSLASLLVALYLLLEKMILKRITSLSSWAQKIAPLEDALGSGRKLYGRDEIDRLSLVFKATVQQIQDEKNKYKTLFKNMLDGFARHRIILDQNGQPIDYEFLEVNMAFEKITGLTSDDIIGKRVSQVMPDLVHEEFNWVAAYGQVALKGGELRMERYCQSLDRWFSIVAFQTEPGGFATVFEDITERITMLKRLEESEERFRQVAESTDLWVWEVNQDGFYIYSNSSVEKVLGYKPEEIVNKMNFSELFSPESKLEILQEAEAIFLSRDKFVNFRNACVHKDGRTVILETNGVPIFNENGEFLGYRGTDKDITEQQALMEEREAIISELQQALENIKTLKGLIPICASCKKVRNDQGYWQQVEEYVSQHTEADFSHGLCDECARKLYPDYFPQPKTIAGE